MTIVEARRPYANVAADLAAVGAELERRNTEERRRRGDQLEHAEAQFAELLVARDKGESVPPQQIAQARQAVDDGKLEVQANDHTVRNLTRQREELQRELPRAQGEELLDEEARILAQYPQTKNDLLEALLAVVNARGDEHALDLDRHHVRVELDKVAEKTGDSRFRRGVFVFDGAYRPQLERLMDAVVVLCDELQVNIRDSQIVSREQRPSSAIATTAGTAAMHDPVDDLDDEGDDQ